jgi:uncharacterized membrane protein YjfL (UPF0719 family)
MDPMLALVGLARLLFGVFVGVVGITLAARVATRFGGFESVDAGLRGGNPAIGIVLAGAIVAMGILVRHAVTGTFGALELLRHSAESALGVAVVLAYAAAHLIAALGVGVALLVAGMRIFVGLTPEIDEVREIHEGNLASALVLAAVLVVLALLAQQGVETMIDALLPLPTLGRDTMLAPG